MWARSRWTRVGQGRLSRVIGRCVLLEVRPRARDFSSNIIETHGDVACLTMLSCALFRAWARAARCPSAAQKLGPYLLAQGTDAAWKGRQRPQHVGRPRRPTALGTYSPGSRGETALVGQTSLHERRGSRGSRPHESRGRATASAADESSSHMLPLPQLALAYGPVRGAWRDVAAVAGDEARGSLRIGVAGGGHFA